MTRRGGGESLTRHFGGDPALLGDGFTPVARAADAEIAFWGADAILLPIGDVLNVLDMRGVAPRSLPIGAGLLMVGSEAEYGAWAGSGVPAVVVPEQRVVWGSPTGSWQSLHVLAGDAQAHEARAAIGWARARGLSCGVAGPLALVAELGAAPALGPGAVVLDLSAGLAPSAALLDGLAAGAPCLFDRATPTSESLVEAGAGTMLPLDGFAALPDLRRLTMSAAAHAFVAARHGPERAGAALRRALAAVPPRPWPRLGHVLVVSDEALNLRDLRVHLPLDALVHRGTIAGYAVLRGGGFVHATEAVTPDRVFDAIWVQRSTDPLVPLLLTALGKPYVYDLDDLLTVSPAYRPAFSADSLATVRALLRGCAVLSCATERLARSLGAPVAVVAPNLADGPAETVAGAPRTLVWASSDAPALAGSGADIVRAVRDFCRAHRLAVLCIGAPPPPALMQAGLAVEHVGLLSRPAYLARLRAAAPGILVGPLETGADPDTQRFIDAKSDVKVIEARRAGLVGVFSRAAPYVDSVLGPAILCDNTYEAWLEGLERARRECLRPVAPPPWPPERQAGGTGPRPWAEALARARCRCTGAEVLAAVRVVRAQAESLLTTPARFDEADYLERHPDVRDAVAAGIVASGYRHYLQSGFREGRLARRLPAPGDDRAQWWTRLLQTVDRLETTVARRDAEIAGLGNRLLTRRALPDPPKPTPTEGVGGLRWHGGGSLPDPCPVCDAAGPHPVLLEIDGRPLARCGTCGACRYAERVPYPYERADDAPLLLRFTLEQNAGIFHQLRLLFALQDVGSVLDVGCGFGFAVAAAAAQGWRAVGIDPSFYAAAGAAALDADIRHAAFEGGLGTFDLVLASEVIEHVADPDSFLRLLRGAVAPGGALLLTTPDAARIGPDLPAAELFGILAPGVHLLLFSPEALTLALQRAGFRHVEIRREAGGLVAAASDRPLRRRPDAAEAHLAAYEALLRRLLETAPPGSPLWNGAAGRLLGLRPDDALARRVEAVWRDRFGFELAAPPAPSLDSGRPLNLGPVLLARAQAERRRSGAVLPWAALAAEQAERTAHLLQARNLVDLDLLRVAAEARLLLIETAPALRVEALCGLLGTAPDPAVRAAAAAELVRLVERGDHGRARALAERLGDVDGIADPVLRVRALFALGVVRLHGGGDALAAFQADALAAFQAMEREAGALLDDPAHRRAAAEFLRAARAHQDLAAARPSP